MADDKKGGLFSKAKKAASKAKDAAKSGASKAKEAAKSGASKAKDAAKEAAKNTAAGAKTAATDAAKQAGSDVLSGAKSSALDAAKTVAGSAKDSAGNILKNPSKDALKQAAKDISGSAKTAAIDAGKSTLESGKEAALEAAKSTATGTAGAAKDSITDAAKGAFAGSGVSVPDAPSADAIEKIASDAAAAATADTAKGLRDTAKEAATNAAKSVADSAKETAKDAAKDAASNAAAGAADAVKGAAGDFAGSAKDSLATAIKTPSIDSFKGAAKEIAGSAKEAAKEAAKGAIASGTDAAKEAALGAANDVASSALGAASEAAKAVAVAGAVVAADAAKNAATKAASKASNAIKGLFGKSTKEPVPDASDISESIEPSEPDDIGPPPDYPAPPPPDADDIGPPPDYPAPPPPDSSDIGPPPDYPAPPPPSDAPSADAGDGLDSPAGGGGGGETSGGEKGGGGAASDMPRNEQVTQEGAPLTIDHPMGERDTFIMRRLSVLEKMDELFKIEAHVISKRTNIEFEDIVGKTVGFRVEQIPEDRYFHGVVSNFMQYATSDPELDEVTWYELKVRPKLWLLTLTKDCRVYQNQTPLDIIKDIFGEFEITDYEIRAQGGNIPREYCIQYNESYFDFVCRLMEEEGICYFFMHEPKGETSEGKHIIVLADMDVHFEPCEGSEMLEYDDSDQEMPNINRVVRCDYRQRVATNERSANDYNMTTASTDLYSLQPEPPENETMFGEFYEYEGQLDHEDIPSQGRLESLMNIRLQEEITLRKSIFMKSTAPYLFAGGYFHLLKHHRNDMNNKDYVVYEVLHEMQSGVVPGYEDNTREQLRDLDDSEDSVSEGVMQSPDKNFIYRNTVVAFDKTLPYRPKRKHKMPRIMNIQSAVVTGPPGEEIHTDTYGRIKIQFKWDRVWPEDDTSSCWVRVQESWGGDNWGFVFTPRIGMEVLVAFINGNPNRPVVTGCVYNSDHMPPYLPERVTGQFSPSKSGIKTKSTLSDPNEEAFNELRFEDLKGEEQIYIRAEKDYDVRINENETRHIIGGSKWTTIENGDRRVVLEGKGGGLPKTTPSAQDLPAGVGDDSLILNTGSRHSVFLSGNGPIKDTVLIEEGLSEYHNKKGSRSRVLELGHDKTTIQVGNHETVVETGDVFTKVITGNHRTVVETGDRTHEIVTGNDNTLIHTGSQQTQINTGDHKLKIDKGNIGIQLDEGNKKQLLKKGDYILDMEKGDQYITLQSGDQIIKITGNQYETVSDNYEGTYGGDYTLTIEGYLTIVAQKGISISTPKSIEMSAGQDITIEAGNDISISAGMKMTETSGMSMSMTAGTSMSQTSGLSMSMKAGTTMDMTCGASMTATCGAAYTLTSGGAGTFTIGGAKTVTTGGALTQTVGGAVTQTAAGVHGIYPAMFMVVTA